MDDALGFGPENTVYRRSGITIEWTEGTGAGNGHAVRCDVTATVACALREIAEHLGCHYSKISRRPQRLGGSR